MPAGGPRTVSVRPVPERIEVDGVALAFERSPGDRLAAVFVHGLGGRREVWGEQRQAFATAGFDAIAIDLPGHGDSAKPPGPYSVESWAATVVGLLDELAIEHVALIGHSIGCTVVEQAAVSLGERCTALAMLGGALSFSEEFKATLRERAELARAGRMREIGEAVAKTGLTEGAHARRPDLAERVVELIASNDPEAYAESALATSRAAMTGPGDVGCPALAFAGAEDPVGPPAEAERIAAALPQGETAVVEAGAHMCMLEVGGRVSRVLLEFLQARTIG